MLRRLDISRARFSGTLPASLSMPELTVLKIDHNSFHGPLPAGLSQSLRGNCELTSHHFKDEFSTERLVPMKPKAGTNTFMLPLPADLPKACQSSAFGTYYPDGWLSKSDGSLSTAELHLAAAAPPSPPPSPQPPSNEGGASGPLSAQIVVFLLLIGILGIPGVATLAFYRKQVHIWCVRRRSKPAKPLAGVKQGSSEMLA